MDNKLSKAVLVGIAGSNNAFSLSIYNLKAFAYNDSEIRDKWDISIIQHPLINVNRKDIEVLPLIDRIINAKPDLVLRDGLVATDVPGWDSFNHVNLMIIIEQEFGVKFTNEEVVKMQNVADLKNVLKGKPP